jgi:16S rRNA (uracil1498-N3)-methyltransferase
MHRSYVSKEWMNAFIAEPQQALPEEAANRFFSVLRIKSGEEIGVFDGDGREVRGKLHRHRGGIYFVSYKLHVVASPQPKLVLVQAAIDESKFKETIQRSTEFGVDRIIVFAATFSEQYCFAKLMKRHERLKNIAIDASRQSGRLFIPAIIFLSSIKEVIELCKQQQGRGLFGDPLGKLRLSSYLANHPHSEHPIYIAIGPEGGFHQKEEQALKDAEFSGVLWAPYVLRTELAGLAAIAIINAYIGRA